MTRLDSCSQRSALVAALMAVAVAACAPAARGALTHVGPMCVAPASPHWAVSQGRASRTLTVRLEVLSEASASWRLDGRMRLDSAIAAWNRAGLPVRLARVSEREAASIRVIEKNGGVLRETKVLDPTRPPKRYYWIDLS